MLQLNVVHLDTRNILISSNLYIIHDKFEKEYNGQMCWILLQETDWLTGYFYITSLCYCLQEFNNCCRGLPFVIEYNNIEVLSTNSWYKHLGTSLNWKLFTNQMQVICVVIRKEVMLNQLEDLLALNICAQKSFQCLRLRYSGSKILDNIIAISTKWSINEMDVKVATLKAAFL